MLRRRMTRVSALCLVLVVCLLPGCVLWQAEPSDPDWGQAPAEEIAAQATTDRQTLVGDLVRYSVSFVVETQNADVRSDLEKEMRTNSLLQSLINEPPDSDLGLERRYRDDVETAKKLLRSQGYYNGDAVAVVDWKASPPAVALTLTPGPRFTVGTSSIRYDSPPGLPTTEAAGSEVLKKAPTTLARFGLKDGEPAVAEAVSKAVDTVPQWLAMRGFPFASATPRYVLYRSENKLDPEVTVKTGEFARFGPVQLSGTDAVNVAYLQRLAPWETGDTWSQFRLDAYRDTLQQTGLFREVNVAPGKLGADGQLPVQITATEAPPRKLSGGVRYSTTEGYGVQGQWEHRNLFSEGETLRFTVPVLENRQEFAADYTMPAFGRRDQNLVMKAALRNEDSDAYDLTAAAFEGGLDRRLSRKWWLGARLSGQTGRIRENDEGWKTYHFMGVPLSARYDGSNSLLNPTRGVRGQVTVTPYLGFYEQILSMLKVQGEASAYHSPFRNADGRPSDKLVLAARAALGVMPGTTGRRVEDVPASLRFYTGGGGSVRGYKYRSIGPKDRHGDPRGGLSYSEVNFEARFRVTETLGIVPFVDGGMVYESPVPSLGKNMAWAAGLGFRYYTAMGPLRLDIAVPLQHRSGNDAFQFYISIGQAF